MIRVGITLLIVTAFATTGVLCLSSPHTTNTGTNPRDVAAVEHIRTAATLSRRSCLAKVAAGLLTGAALAGDRDGWISGFPVPRAFAEETTDQQSVAAVAVAASTETETDEASQQPLLETKRNNLLQSIRSSKSNEAEVLAAIETLVPLDPSGSKGATLAKDLDGEWELLWSAKAEAFSPLLKLPKPLKPDSFQYLGTAAAGEVGPDRVAQGLTGGILGQKQLWLSSGVRPSVDDASVLEILPPFRFEVGGRYGTGIPKNRVVEAGSDAEFRKLNARTTEAQEAPKNSYKQLYLEREGRGSLRISTITAGDPVIVGAIFVHRKL
mmetsp:Transcript_11143/g.32216  ORF Transcript_11143/g.32216 Transcript_11143/m.32216 type:complete len:324 (+) Transcript_11143:350-1321(+)|eukprot:CAMPEP_0172357680 /NCGR_PEP_ID=MMETSP1060-20121228/2045_1 /TAXON_ID=37318 /ORGANISM="Pseudo-nitzschia pungens, Strain cf. cingulata" /LENGTH=323 /DNA_ID=CAMNT_0013078485 /DNA_START=236 /DNA_END=1207 /DNA_ORIENTATION=+